MMCDQALPSVTFDLDKVANSNNNATESDMPEVTENNTMCANRDGKQRSRSGKRRSSFSRGRISLTQLSRDTLTSDSHSTGGELYRQIPADLSPAQRLCLLSRLALRHTLEILNVEYEDSPGFDSFKTEAFLGVGQTIDQMESDGTFEQATKTILAANPFNLQMTTTMADLKRSIGGLQEESRAWEDFVATLESQEQGSKQRLEQLDKDYGDIPEDIKELSASFLPPALHLPDLLTPALHLPDLLTQAVDKVKATSLLMDDYCHSVRLLNYVSRAASKHMDLITNTLDYARGCRGHDPKENIQQLLAL